MMKLNWKLLAAGVGVLAVLAMAGCGDSDNTAGTTKTVFTASNKYDGDLSNVTLHIGAASSKNAQGIVEAAGLADTPYKVEFHNLRSGSQVLESIAAGQLEAGCGSQIPPILLHWPIMAVISKSSPSERARP